MKTAQLSVLFLVNILFIFSECKEIEDISADKEETFTYRNTLVGNLAEIEGEAYDVIADFLKDNEQYTDSFQRYVSDFTETSLKILRDFETKEDTRERFFHRIQAHPFLEHRMIWRIANEFPEINATIQGSNDKKGKERLKEIFEGVTLPTKNDLRDSMRSLLSISDIYDFDTLKFADGKFSSIDTGISLSAIHCFEIAEFAYQNKEFTDALQWLEVSNTKSKRSNRHPILDIVNGTEVMKLLKNVVKEHNSGWKIEDYEDPELNVYTHFVHKIKPGQKLVTRKSVFRDRLTGKKAGNVPKSLQEETQFPVLCEGKNLQSEKEKANLFCSYVRKLHPYWLINPQKMEMLNIEPLLFLIHDFFGDEVIEIFKKTSITRFGLPQVENSLEYELIAGNETTAAVTVADFKKNLPVTLGNSVLRAWIGERGNPKVEHIVSKIKFLTGLKSTDVNGSMSNYRTVAYSTGGYFNVHHDTFFKDPLNKGAFEKSLERIGDNMGTFTVYLNDVKLGGRTAFPFIGVSVTPKKGTAVFWYNTKRNGQVDERLRHAGCPVILGEKWILNKWTYQNVNMFERKCSLNPEE